MKKLNWYQRIVEKLWLRLWWGRIRSYWPWHLKRVIRKQEYEIHRRYGESAAPSEQTARAMLMQLRVHQESVRHRTGYMVSAFIPQGVVEKLIERGPAVRNRYVALVAEVLVTNALSGIYKRSSATGKLTALVFSPLGHSVELVGGIYETNEKPVFVGMRAATGDEQKLLQ